MRRLRRIQFIALLAQCGRAVVVLAKGDTAQPTDFNSAVESLGADLRADKVAIISEAMQFSDEDSTAFWADLPALRVRSLEAKR